MRATAGTRTNPRRGNGARRRFVHDARSSDNIDWLEYRHIEPLVPASPAGAILDGSPYDQSESRPLNPVADFSLCFDLETSTDGAVHLRAQSRGDLFEVTLDAAAGQSTLAHNGRLVRRAPWTATGRAGDAQVELALVDHRVRLAVDGVPSWQYDFRPQGGAHAAAAPLAIGARAARVEVGNLRVFRDVYYTTDPTAGGQYRLGPGEYFVLGDNSAHSADSRSWTSPVSAGLLLGPALAW